MWLKNILAVQKLFFLLKAIKLQHEKTLGTFGFFQSVHVPISLYMIFCLCSKSQQTQQPKTMETGEDTNLLEDFSINWKRHAEKPQKDHLMEGK